MWLDDYEALNAYDKEEFRRIGNYLLSHTYLVRYSYQPSEEMTLPNRDYKLAVRYFSILKAYFELTGWQLDCDENYGYMSLISVFGNNRSRLDQFTTLFLYTCRLFYEEQRQESSSTHAVCASTSEIVQKMVSLGLLKNGKTTQKERLDAQRTLAHFNIIEKMEPTAWEPDGNRFLILPSILSIVTNQGISDMLSELAELQSNAGGDETEVTE